MGTPRGSCPTPARSPTSYWPFSTPAHRRSTSVWAACGYPRASHLRIGAAHEGPTPTVESLSAALRTALSPETRARAVSVAGAIVTAGAAVAAKLHFETIAR